MENDPLAVQVYGRDGLIISFANKQVDCEVIKESAQVESFRLAVPLEGGTGVQELTRVAAYSFCTQ